MRYSGHSLWGKERIYLAYSTVVALLFAPTIFVFYNYTAWVYVIGYGLLALTGSVIGKLFYTGVK